MSSLALLPAATHATTYGTLADARLAERSPVVAEVLVLAQDRSPASLRPATDYTVQVERLVQGSVTGSTLVVRVPGGAPVDGAAAPGLKVWGAPTLRPDERSLLFLAPNADGSFRVVDLALGAFHEIEWSGRRLAVRDLSEMMRLPGGRQTVAEAPRDLERFVAWLAARQPSAAGAAAAAPDYEVALGAAGRRAVEEALLGLSSRAEWPVAAGGAAAAAELVWTSRNGGQAGWPDLASLTLTERQVLTGSGEAQAVQNDRRVQLSYAGAARSAADLESFTGETTLLLAGPAADPDLAPAAFDCRTGGVASVTGTWYSAEGQVLGGGVIVAAGAACLLAGAPAAHAGAWLGHELTLAGLGAGAARLPGSAAPAGGVLAPAASAASALASSNAAPVFAGGASALADLFAAAAPPGAGSKPGAAGGEDTGKGRRRAKGGGNAGGGFTSARGYQARACGFDLNRNGVFGEAADCQTICNGSAGTRDAGGVLRNQIYVSCNSGADTASCGSASNPCHTIGYAWNSRISPAGSNAADVICFRGTCHEESITPGVSGKAGVYLKPRTGSETQAFELPTHPTMLVGWDYNHNGRYPPYDTNDVAVLDGTGLAEAIALSRNTPNSYLELAHFTVRNYGTTAPAGTTNAGFLTMGSAPGSSNHVYVHDISVQNVNSGKPLDSGNIIFNFFTGNNHVQWAAFENVEVVNAGGYLVRGNGPFGATADTRFENGPYRFERISLTGRACNASGAGACSDPGTEAHVVGFKLWGYITGIEVLDSVLKLNPTAWTPWPSGFGSTAFVAAQCSRNWTLRNNEVDDFKVGLTVQGYATGYCDGAGARPVDGVLFDRNVFRNTYAPWIYGNNGVVVVGGGPNPHTSVAKVVVSGNDFSSPPGWQGMAYIDAGNSGGPDPGNIQLIGNTTYAPLSRPGFGAITLAKDNPFPAQSFYVHNNLIAGTNGQENVHAEYAPAAWDSDANVFDPAAAFTWNHSVSCPSLPPWRTASGHDAASRACTPQFVNAAGGDFHLAAGDTCAGTAGTALNAH